MNKVIELFPITIATGKAFCNRTKERLQLKQFIRNGRHVVLIAPRRYGKTSLINQTLLELKLPSALLELTLAVNIKDVEQIIIQHVSNLLYSILPRATKSRQVILRLFKWLRPELVLTAGGQKLAFNPDWDKLNPVDTISEVLKKLDEASGLVGKRVVVVMDEFQQLSEMEGYIVESSIRHAMQYSKYTTYVFSGSHRHMLLDMFNRKSRPFYNSCEIMSLGRIEMKDYKSFIQGAAQEQWGKPLSRKVLDKIFSLTEFHPSYINRLCGYFWLTNEYPSPESVDQYWWKLVESKRSELAEDILSLSKNQRKILTHFATFPTTQPGGQDVCKATGLSEASIRQALKVISSKDYIFKTEEGEFKVLDPVMRDYIKHINIMD